MAERQSCSKRERKGRDMRRLTRLELCLLLLELGVLLAQPGVKRTLVALGLQRLQCDLDCALLEVSRLGRRVGVPQGGDDALVDELAQLLRQSFALLVRRGLALLALELRVRRFFGRRGVSVALPSCTRGKERTKPRLGLDPLLPRLVQLLALGVELSLQSPRALVSLPPSTGSGVTGGKSSERDARARSRSARPARRGPPRPRGSGRARP